MHKEFRKHCIKALLVPYMIKTHYSLSDFDYNLPEELIAQYPSKRRENSRLFVIDHHNRYHHRHFADVLEFLQPGDVLVINDTKVLPARIILKRESGGKVEMVLTQKLNEFSWLAITNRSSRLKEGERLFAENDMNISVVIEGRTDNFIRIKTSIDLDEKILNRIGTIPLPPYIKRQVNNEDFERYQTVYAEKVGAVAAPTAGLHFTKELLSACIENGVEIAKLTLAVSWGTFSPVRNENLLLHTMHSEKYFLSEDSARTINEARKSGRRIIAVGTTSLRVLESTYRDGLNIPGDGTTSIFIYPPYKINSADCLITNFHTPCSTLLMLVCAFGGYEVVMDAYREAVRQRYRFFSYGDAMLIIRKK